MPLEPKPDQPTLTPEREAEPPESEEEPPEREEEPPESEGLSNIMIIILCQYIPSDTVYINFLQGLNFTISCYKNYIQNQIIYMVHTFFD